MLVALISITSFAVYLKPESAIASLN